VAKWTASDIPDQSGRTVLITGANSGLGLHSALLLARKGAKVLLACRSAERGRAALAQVAAGANTKPELVELDLADLGSVRSAAADVRERTADALDVLMNNAGVMAPPKRETQDGFELQIGTNHLGHAALTWLLIPALRERPGARVVTVSSLAHQGGNLDTADLNFTRRRYSPLAAYSQSKLANLLFAFQLDRSAREHGLDLVSVAAHPGLSATEIAFNSARQHSLPALLGKGAQLATKLIAQPVTKGVLPQLFAATAPEVSGGQYYGPDGIGETRGHPKLAKPSSTASDRDIAERLWKVTTELTGVAADPG
jgi:NAD(P)-dependent dehydrogenase (short-subunit alcohol dehydrogenase family)